MTTRSVTRVLLTLTTLVLMGAAVACGGGDSRIDGSSDAPTEDSLRETAEIYGQSLLDREYARMYSYFHEDYKEKCPEDDWLALAFWLVAFVPEITEAEFQLDDVRIDEDGRGYLSGDYYLDGRPLGFDEEDSESEYWTFEDGKWWVHSDEEDPCNTDIEVEVETASPG